MIGEEKGGVLTFGLSPFPKNCTGNHISGISSSVRTTSFGRRRCFSAMISPKSARMIAWKLVSRASSVCAGMLCRMTGERSSKSSEEPRRRAISTGVMSQYGNSCLSAHRVRALSGLMVSWQWGTGMLVRSLTYSRHRYPASF